MPLRLTTIPDPVDCACDLPECDSCKSKVPMLVCESVLDRSAGTLYVIRTSHNGRVVRYVYDGVEIEAALAGCSLDVWMGAKVEIFELDFETVVATSTARARIESAQYSVDCDPQYENAREELREYRNGLDKELALAGY